jgi:hypothetical protein
MTSRIIEGVSKKEFKMGDVVRADKLYILCTSKGKSETTFSGVVLHEGKGYVVGVYSETWIISAFEKVSATIEFT